MFRDHETKYLVVSVSLVPVFTLLLASYEMFYKTSDSGLDTVIAIAHGVSAAVAITITLVATWYWQTD